MLINSGDNDLGLLFRAGIIVGIIIFLLILYEYSTLKNIHVRYVCFG